MPQSRGLHTYWHRSCRKHLCLRRIRESKSLNTLYMRTSQLDQCRHCILSIMRWSLMVLVFHCLICTYRFQVLQLPRTPCTHPKLLHSLCSSNRILGCRPQSQHPRCTGLDIGKTKLLALKENRRISNGLHWFGYTFYIYYFTQLCSWWNLENLHTQNYIHNND